MGSLLADLAVDQHDDPVGVPDRGEAVGDHQRGPAFHQVLQRILNLDLRLRVEGGGRLVEDQDRGVLEDGAGDRDPLAFAAGELRPLLADQRVVAHRQAHDEIVGVRGLRGGGDLLLRLHDVAVGDVVPDRVVEEDRLLGHDRDLSPERLDGDVADVTAVDRDRPFRHVVKAGDQVDKRCLSPAAHADEGDHLAGADSEIDVPEDRRLLIAEGNVPDLDLPGDPGKGGGVGEVPDLRDQVDDRKDPLGAGDPLLDRVVHVRQPFHRFVQHDQRRQKGKKGSRRRLAVDHLVAAVEDDRGDAEAAEELHEGAGDGVDRDRLQVETEETFILPRETPVLILLHAEGLDDPGSGDRLLQKGHQASEGDLRSRCHLPHLLAEFGDRIDGKRKDEHRDDGQPPVAVEDHEDEADQRERVFE